MKADKFVISNINDTHKILSIERSIQSHEGINAARVDVQANTVTVDYDEAKYSEGEIKNFITQAGLNVIKT